MQERCRRDGGLIRPVWLALALSFGAGVAVPATAQVAGASDGAPGALGAGERPDVFPYYENHNVQVSLHWENDSSPFKPWGNKDRYYTNATGITAAWPSPKAKDALDGLLGEWLGPSDAAAFGLVFAHEIYTPNDLLADPPDPMDRPYAAYLHGGAYIQRQEGRHLDHLQLDLGVVGPSAQGKGVQVGIHDFFAGDDPMGWDSQLGDEVAVQLGYRHKVRLDPWVFDVAGTPTALQLIPAAELNLGTVRRNVAGTGLLRWGVNLPDDFGPGRLHDPASATGHPRRPMNLGGDHPLGLDSPWSVYGFVRGTARYVEWNTFLEGSNWRNPSPSVSAEPWVGELETGVSLAYRFAHKHRLEFIYSNVWLTRTFEEQDNEHNYASLTLQWTCAF